jgi:hypothetical protein
MTEILIGIFCVIFGMVWGWNARGNYAKRRLDMLLEQIKDSDVDEQEESIIPIVIEKHNDVFYVYGKNDNTFMAQGDTRWHLEKNLEKRYPGKKFGASTENLREIGFVNDTNT